MSNTSMSQSYNPSVSLKEALIAPFNFKSKCLFYSFPLGVISIINFLTLCLILILSITAMFTGIASLDGWKILAGIFILFGGIFLNLFMFYTQAYLIKGCQCSKQLSSVEQKPPPLNRQNAQSNLQI